MMAINRKSGLTAFGALLLLTIIWGYNWVVMKSALQYAGAFQFAAIRTMCGALLLFLVIFFTKRPFKLKQWPTIVLLGLLQTCGFTGLLIWALVEGGAGKTAVLTYTMPFWVMLLAWPILHEKIKGWQWLAVIFSVVGIVMFFDPAHAKGELFSLTLGVLSGVFWALSVIISKKLHQSEPQLDLLTLTAWPMFLGSIPLALVALVVPAPPIQWTPYFISAVLFNVVLAGALAWLLWLYALQRLPAGVASMASMLAPVIGVIAAWLQLGETPNQTELIGMLLIGLALAVISVITIRSHKNVDPAQGQE